MQCLNLLGSHGVLHQNDSTAEPSSSFVSFPLLLALTSFSNARLKAASQEAEAVRRDQPVWERKVGELQARCTTLEEEKYEALAKVRESVQVAEEAALQKDQVTAVFFSFPFCPVSEINFLTHQPRALLDEKIHQPSMLFTSQNNELPFCVTYTFVLVHFIEIM